MSDVSSSRSGDLDLGAANADSDCAEAGTILFASSCNSTELATPKLELRPEITAVDQAARPEPARVDGGAAAAAATCALKVAAAEGAREVAARKETFFFPVAVALSAARLEESTILGELRMVPWIAQNCLVFSVAGRAAAACIAARLAAMGVLLGLSGAGLSFSLGAAAPRRPARACPGPRAGAGQPVPGRAAGSLETGASGGGARAAATLVTAVGLACSPGRRRRAARARWPERCSRSTRSFWTGSSRPPAPASSSWRPSCASGRRTSPGPPRRRRRWCPPRGPPTWRWRPRRSPTRWRPRPAPCRRSRRGSSWRRALSTSGIWPGMCSSTR
ncbi:unnamed protein product [Prorocentrum cordatum]|uniref:Solute carrier family 40 protein n=1 Tax=Prorocentrum cordatum TaxID=2364126 RepID=A0ABN9WLE1_9DINO|nr:unnamed protein product [Polarella glacialis]